MTDLPHLFEMIVTGFVGLLAWLMSLVHGNVQKNERDLAAFKTHVAINHPLKDSIDGRFDRIEEKMDHRFDKLEEKIEMRRDKQRSTDAE